MEGEGGKEREGGLEAGGGEGRKTGGCGGSGNCDRRFMAVMRDSDNTRPEDLALHEAATTYWRCC